MPSQLLIPSKPVWFSLVTPGPPVGHHRISVNMSLLTGELVLKPLFRRSRDLPAYHVSSLKPKIVIIQVGVNDLKTIPLFPESRNAIVANCQANIKRIVEESKNLGAVVIVTTIFPVGEVPLERKPFWSDDISRAIKEVNTYIATLAGDKIIVFDTFPIIGDSQGMILPKYRSDELHLNAEGYEILNQNLSQLLNTMEQKKVQK